MHSDDIKNKKLSHKIWEILTHKNITQNLQEWKVSSALRYIRQKVPHNIEQKQNRLCVLWDIKTEIHSTESTRTKNIVCFKILWQENKYPTKYTGRKKKYGMLWETSAQKNISSNKIQAKNFVCFLRY